MMKIYSVAHCVLRKYRKVKAKIERKHDLLFDIRDALCEKFSVSISEADQQHLDRFFWDKE